MSEDLVKAHLDHKRMWADFDYCYPVISRRSKGVSLGVNLNPDKVCNFNCVYCEVDRATPAKRKDIDLDQLEREMAALLDLTLDGTLFRVAPFDSARPEQRRLNDIAFSGDGEPTTAPEFADAVDRIAKLKWARGLHEVKLVLITDSSRLQAREVIQGLDTLQANNGEIWAKLDAGTETYYKTVNRSAIPFQKILDNLEITARLRPLLIQTLFFSWQGQGLPTQKWTPTSDACVTFCPGAASSRASSSTRSRARHRSPKPGPEGRRVGCHRREDPGGTARSSP